MHRRDGNHRVRLSRGLGLRAKVIAAWTAVVVALLSVALVGNILLDHLEHELLSLYQERVVPLRELKAVSDRYAIDIVDSIHKVLAERISSAEGARRVAHGRLESAHSWKTFISTRPALETDAVRETQPLFDQADAVSARAEALMTLDNRAALEQLRRGELYPAVDPLTERLERLVDSEVSRTDALVRNAREDLLSLRRTAAITLSLISAVALGLAFFFSRRLVQDLTAMRDVVQSVAMGDLSRRVKSEGSDELAQMAAHIDTMIDALARSQKDLSEHTAALARAVEKSDAASTAKSLFLRSMSHELRTPLNVILGYAQLMSREPSRSSEDLRALQSVLDAGRHLLVLIEDVLSISKIEEGRLSTHSVAFSPILLTQGVCELLRPRARSNGVELRFVPASSVPQFIMGDEGKLKQILINLVGNALKFTLKGQVLVTLSYKDETLHGSVRDTGPGIAANELALLFHTFFQGQAGHVSAEGTGLGLYISRSLARLMNGDITCESVLGKGSEFKFHIAAPTCELAPATELTPKLRYHLREGVEIAPMLVVDDRAANRDVLGQMLQGMGFKTVQAQDGAEAVALCATNDYSIVWMDLRMPILSGIPAVQRIRKADHEKGVTSRRYVAVTASVVELDREGARTEGFDDLLNKPFALEELVAGVASLLHLTVERTILDNAHDRVSPANETDALEQSSITTLPHAVRAKLLTSLVAGDVAAAKEVVRGIVSPTLSQELLRIVDSFDFDSLIFALRAVEDTHAESHS